MSPFKSALCAALWLLGAGIQIVHATPILWTLQNFYFSDGGTASGSFIYDADTNVYSSVDITSTAGTRFGGTTYSEIVSGAASIFYASASVPNFLGQPILAVLFQDNLTGAGGIDKVIILQEGPCAQVNAGKCGAYSLYRGIA